LSQLLDSLRPRRQPKPAQPARRTAQGDAVLATFGYRPALPRGRTRSRLAMLLVLGGAIATGWVGWNVIRRPDAPDFGNALQHYRALLRRNELDAQAHNNLGLLYQERNLLDESARELQRAIVIEPRNAGMHNNYGVTLLKLGRADEAQAEFTAALALAPRNVDAIVNLALAQRDARRPDIARDTLLRALSIEPRNAAAHYNLAQLYDQANQTASAVDHYGRFLENAGAEYASRIAAVRVRIEVLTRDPD
jgi:Flp pilus assembly protein TadD